MLPFFYTDSNIEERMSWQLAQNYKASGFCSKPSPEPGSDSKCTVTLTGTCFVNPQKHVLGFNSTLGSEVKPNGLKETNQLNCIPLPVIYSDQILNKDSETVCPPKVWGTDWSKTWPLADPWTGPSPKWEGCFQQPLGLLGMMFMLP